MGRDKETSTKKFAELRKRADLWIGEKAALSTTLSITEARRLLHELHTYQIELELQNEDLRHSQTELERSRRSYSDLYDFAPVGYLTVAENGLITKANLTAAEMFDVPRKRLLQRAISNFIVPDDQHIFHHCRKKLLATKTKQSCELRLQKKGGVLIHVLLESTVKPEVDGSTGQFRLAITDISERHELETILQNAKNEWEKTFDAISDIITVQDTDMRIVRANRAAHETFQAAPGGLNGRHCYELFRGTNTPCPHCPAIATLQEATPHSETIIHKNMGRTFSVTCAPLLNEQGEFSRIVHIARDITTKKKMAAELAQARKMEAIGTLAGGIAHDFNNILAAIIGYADMARHTLPAGSTSKNHIEQVLKAGNRAKELVNQILTFSRKGFDQPEPLDPAPITKEALKLLRASLPTTIEIQQEITPDCGIILAHPSHIHQVIVNFCTNALYAMKQEKGVLTVKLRPVELKKSEVSEEPDVSPGPFVELMIRDTGCGMDARTSQRIFEPYFTTKEFGKGSGMGLALAHGIVQSCGGFIKIESAPQKGTTFHVFFPAIAARPFAPAKEEQQETPKGNERILAVDDEEPIAEMYKEILEQLGYQVTARNCSKQTLELFLAAPDDFDLLITDQTMPHLSGTELAKKILEIRPDMPIIMCTGYSSLISEEKAHEMGIEKFVMKPFNQKELAATIREVLDKKKAS
ncbi:MAG: response regulator [Desulfurivibrionaceae bacterium]|nr:response regulator [Desulfurivibrionaceae bacterium]